MCTITDEVAVTVYRSDRDGVPVVEIDTQEGAGPLRVNLNDGNIWDGDPEEDVPAILDAFTVQPDHTDQSTITCSDCGDMVGRLIDGSTLRDYIADAKAHVPSCTKRS